MEDDNLNLRDSYYTEIHSLKAKWWMQWGIMVVFLILLILLILGHFVKYPDSVISELRMTTNQSSVKFPLLVSTQIQVILVKNDSEVKVDMPLIILKNNANHEHVYQLENALNNFSFKEEEMLSFFETFFDKDMQLGDIIENDWITFSSELLDLYKIKKLNIYQDKISFLQQELSNQIVLKKKYEELIIVDSNEQKLLDEQFRTDSILYSKDVISKMNFNQNQQNYLSKKKLLEQNQLALYRTDLAITRLKNSIENYRNKELEEILTKEINIRKTINLLKSSILEWKKIFVLTSPIQGKVVFLQDIKENSFFQGDIIVIAPKEKNFYATTRTPFVGAGKVKVGQRVIIKLDDYPYREYGTIEGVLSEFSVIAGENYYLGKVNVPARKETSYGKEIVYKENMSGIGEIITNDRNILERIFERLSYAFKRE